MKAFKNRYLVKIVPPVGYRVFRLEFSRRHIFAAIAGVALTLLGVATYYGSTLWRAEARVGELRSLTIDQRERLQKIDAQAAELDTELRTLQQQNDQIRKMIGDGSQGVRAKPQPAGQSKDDRSSMLPDAEAFAAVAARIERLRTDSLLVTNDGNRLRNLALHVLNMRRLEDLARARVLAAIPSISPTGDLDITSPFGWRVTPWPEFHEGVDLAADYGTPIRAAAAGTVVTAGYDGGFGNMVDLDHGNGYHTYYAHLSRIDVEPGQYVMKAQHIALAGASGEATGPHLHYQIMLDGHPIDPAPYLTGIPQKVLASLK
ncbi:MAG: M23 family metallopeptidase [Candidatus Baltobacteraceae bacterium]|jgi:murein DD-endopeptidase MepM/ murein hydrolase activator NlpD